MLILQIRNSNWVDFGFKCVCVIFICHVLTLLLKKENQENLFDLLIHAKNKRMVPNLHSILKYPVIVSILIDANYLPRAFSHSTGCNFQWDFKISFGCWTPK